MQTINELFEEYDKMVENHKRKSVELTELLEDIGPVSY